MPQKYSKLLITGGSGFLGWNLARYAAKSYEVFFTYGHHPISIENCEAYHVNLREPHEIEDLVENLRPDAVIHTAALANADLCEQRRPLAYEINVSATRHFVQCAEDIDCRFLYISTDLVFDGQQGNYVEEDTPRPVNYYGETKLRGEKAVKAASSNYLILRTALMYGPGNGVHGSFLEWMQNALNQGDPVSLFTDQYRTPLFVIDGVRAILELMEDSTNQEIYHLGGRERINRYEFGQHFAQIFSYSQDLIHPVLMQARASSVPRGADCSLNSRKVQHLLSFELSDVATGLQQLRQMLFP